MSRAKNLPIPSRIDIDVLTVAWGASIDPELVTLALVHRSYVNEAGGIANSERLESLGDTVLSIMIADCLLHDHPDSPESDLPRMRVATVSQESLAMAARRIELGDFIYLGKGEAGSGGRNKDSVLSDTSEAMIGAIYLTGGFEIARCVILKNLDFLLVQALSWGPHHDWKILFVGCASQLGLGEVPCEIEGEGPDRDRIFTARAFISSKQESIARGKASSKRYAETAVAEAAMNALAEL